MARTDIHRPSVITPEDYSFVGCEVMKVEGLGDMYELRAQREAIQAHMKQTGGTYSSHAHGGSCHVCGAWAIYTFLFHHKPTNTYIRTGGDCAEKLEFYETERFRKMMSNALEAKAGKAKAAALLEQHGLSKAWEIFQSEDRNEFGTHPKQVYRWGVIVSMTHNLVKYGSMSDKQINYMRVLIEQLAKHDEIEAAREAEHATYKPLPIKAPTRMKVKGTVRSIRRPEQGQTRGMFMVSTKILVQHADGWKVWGTMPSKICNVEVGYEIEFEAKVTVSDKDDKFGFFSRPTKAKIIIEETSK